MTKTILALSSAEREAEVGTSSAPSSWRRQTSLSSPIQIWLSSGTAGSSSLPDDVAFNCLACLESDHLFEEGGTTFGAAPPERTSPTADAVLDIRRRTGLTWQQLARVFDVDRRSLHFWAKGSRPSAAHAERLELVRAILRQVDAGDPEHTRQRLFTSVRSQGSILELLEQKKDREALESVRWILQGPQRTSRRDRRPPALPEQERDARRVFSPLELLETIRESEEQTRSRLIGVSNVPGLQGR